MSTISDGELAPTCTTSMPAIILHVFRNVLLSLSLVTEYVHYIVMSSQLSNNCHHTPRWLTASATSAG